MDELRTTNEFVNRPEVGSTLRAARPDVTWTNNIRSQSSREIMASESEGPLARWRASDCTHQAKEESAYYSIIRIAVWEGTYTHKTSDMLKRTNPQRRIRPIPRILRKREPLQRQRPRLCDIRLQNIYRQSRISPKPVRLTHPLRQRLIPAKHNSGVGHCLVLQHTYVLSE